MGLNRFLLSVMTTVFLFFGAAVIANAQSSSLGSGDLVKITVYGQPDLNTITRIGPDRTISFPLIGKVTIGGLSVGSAEQKIGSELERRNFVRNAQVSILLEEARTTSQNSVTILGEVQTPGIYPLQAHALDGVQTLVDLIARAGGLSKEAADHLLLLKNSQSSHKNAVDLIDLLQRGDLQNNVKLRGGEVVVVPAAEVFYIYGQIQKPGKYRIERNMTVMQAISVGGGVTEMGSENGVSIKRRKGAKLQSISAKLDTRLAADDVIYIKKSIF